MNRTAIRFVQLLFVIGAAGLAYSFVASARDGELRKSCTSVCAMAPTYAGADRIAPDFQLPTLSGGTFRLADWRGKVGVLVFWTTTCEACKKQMPALRELASVAAYDPRFEVMTVAVDESVAEVKATLQKHGGTAEPFPVAMDPESEVVLGKYGTKAFPETWIIDPDGVIRARFDGPRDWSASTALDMLNNLSRGSGCPMTVDKSVARGPGAKVCRDMAR
ncbi:MAG: TlpA family protein disulfide reductase [Myxococcota bacterium]